MTARPAAAATPTPIQARADTNSGTIGHCYIYRRQRQFCRLTLHTVLRAFNAYSGISGASQAPAKTWHGSLERAYRYTPGDHRLYL